MAYQPMTPRLDYIPQDRGNMAHAVTYESPTRFLDQNENTIIEVSDDDSDSGPPPQVSLFKQSRRQQQPSRTLSPGSDADTSDMEFVLESRLAHPARALKRTWTPGSSLSSSPPAAPRDRGKRRANPALARALVVAPGKEARCDLQPTQHRPDGEGTATKQATSLSSPGHHTQHKANLEKQNKKKAAQQSPYYVDGRLEVKMYRGPGYERFPVVLGTVEGHKELCDMWDADRLFKLERKAAKLKEAIRTPYMIHGTDSNSSDDEVEGEGKTAFEKKCLASVVDVFPDIERAYVEKKIRGAPPQPQYVDEDGNEIIDIRAPTLAERIITEILDEQSYPKQRVSNSTANGKGAAVDGTGITITWDRDPPKDMAGYTKDAFVLLCKHFLYVPPPYIAKVVEEKQSIFDSYVTLQGLEDQYYSLKPRPYLRRVTPLDMKELAPLGRHRVPAEYANQVNELQAAKQFVAREAIKEAVKKAKEEAEALNLAEHIKTGAIMECQCCFDAETPLNRIVPCMADVPHFFCFSCVEALADNQVGLLKHEMLCMDASGCAAELSHEDVGRAVPITTFDRLELNKQQAEIMAAKIDGLEQCPCCDYKAICLDVARDPIFFCQNPECARATCRKCKKDSHAPKTCEENNRDKTLSARHLVEEARSEAIIRTCPTCKAKILKDFGCNKMTCTRCGCRMCYICNADITHLGANAYSHFGAKCVLYDDTGINRHENEANEAEKGAINKAKSLDAELDENKLRIDTGKAIKRPSALLNHPGADAFLRDLNNRAARLNDRQTYLQNMQTRVDRLRALQPDRELQEILAGIRAMDGTRGYDRARPPGEARVHIQELENLYRRARVHLARHQPQFPLAPADLDAPAHNHYPEALNGARHVAGNPPPLVPPALNRRAPGALAFGGLARPVGNVSNGVKEGLLGPFNFDFNIGGAQPLMLGSNRSKTIAHANAAHRQIPPATLQPINLVYPQFLGVPAGGAGHVFPTAGRDIEANAIQPPAGSAMPARGHQGRAVTHVAAVLVPHNTAGGIGKKAGRDLLRR
ncbi:uncharacterized protein Z519_01886 [Cladophialophora bantiana CBS 173.52]|uniref:RING-type domain-containing protein n=1 Tax=Cladophialophora bantiana (strain ATCC 10958 / CBS 173.52 / CDC B-1940 / NIH 8579) TaxID=1442370 RepID=A0A0D2GIT7_CLAB1|nr:uncharacterized protein Z519_01886 [Cladophialophora bantiana CBS 173.52]KIW98302.1 hypothetical protein Z519_01886 [Cladophialophora bantiana CBS 173.52]